MNFRRKLCRKPLSNWRFRGSQPEIPYRRTLTPTLSHPMGEGAPFGVVGSIGELLADQALITGHFKCIWLGAGHPKIHGRFPPLPTPTLTLTLTLTLNRNPNQRY